MKKKPLKEIIAERANRAASQDAARKYAIFLNLWDEILESYQDGWTWMYIWETLTENGDMSYSYPTFMHYVRKMRTRMIQEGGKELSFQRRSRNKPKDNPPGQRQPMTPGSNRVDLPTFGEGVKNRDPKRF